LKRGTNKDIGPKDFFEMGSKLLSMPPIEKASPEIKIRNLETLSIMMIS
jgi:hypothetical protein